MKVRLKLQVRPPLDDAIKGYFLQLRKPNTLGAYIKRRIGNDACVTFELCNMKSPDMDAANAARMAGYVNVEHEGTVHQVWRNEKTPPTYVQRNV